MKREGWFFHVFLLCLAPTLNGIERALMNGLCKIVPIKLVLPAIKMGIIVLLSQHTDCLESPSEVYKRKTSRLSF